MLTISLTQAKARLSELLDQFESGQERMITRHGKAVARLSAVNGPKKRLPLEELAKFRASMPKLSRPSAELIREMRDDSH